MSSKNGSGPFPAANQTQLHTWPDLWQVMSPGRGLLMCFLMGGNMCRAALIGYIIKCNLQYDEDM